MFGDLFPKMLLRTTGWLTGTKPRCGGAVGILERKLERAGGAAAVLAIEARDLELEDPHRARLPERLAYDLRITTLPFVVTARIVLPPAPSSAWMRRSMRPWTVIGKSMRTEPLTVPDSKRAE